MTTASMTTAADVSALLSDAEVFMRAEDQYGALARAHEAARAAEHVLDVPPSLRDEIRLAIERYEQAYQAELAEVQRRRERYTANERRLAR